MKYTATIMALLVLSVVIAGCGTKETETTTTTTTTKTTETGTNTQQIDEVTGELIDENEEVNVGDVI